MSAKHLSRLVVGSLSAVVLGVSPVMVAISSSAEEAPTEAEKVDAFATPTPDITDCSERFSIPSECGTVQLPLDYDAPNGPTTKVAYVRVPATDQGNRIGALFVHPGGPGGSAVELAGYAEDIFNEEVRAKFDIVGVDSRGTGESENVRCFKGTKQQDDVFSGFVGDSEFSAFPNRPEQVKSYLNAARDMGEACADQGLPLAAHMSTANVARDMDVIRRVVGSDQMNFLGISYAAYLGNVYANLFPERVRAITLDGGVDPVAWAGTPETKHIPQWSRMQGGLGASAAMEEILRLCEEKGPRYCSFAAKGDPQENYEKLLEYYKTNTTEIANPQSGETKPFGYPELFGYLLNNLSAQQAPGVVADSLTDWYVEAFESSDEDSDEPAISPPADVGPTPEQLQPDETPDAPSYSGDEAYYVITCTDSLNASSLSDWPKFAQAAAQKYSGFGPYWTWASAPCASESWTVEDNDAYRGPFTAHTANPILVTGNYYDPLTNYAGAQTMVDLLPNSRLLSSNTFGHSSYLKSECMDTAIVNYFLTMELPPEGKVCQPDPDFVPFAIPLSEQGASSQEVRDEERAFPQD